MEHKEFVIYFNWAERHKLRIFPIPQNSTGNVLKIAIETNGKIKVGEEKHTDKTIAPKIEELYKTIYFQV